MSFFDKVINRAESLFTHLENLATGVASGWNEAGIEVELREAVLALAIAAARLRDPEIQALNTGELRPVLRLACEARRIGVAKIQEDGAGDERFEQRLTQFVESLWNSRPNLSREITGLDESLQREAKRIQAELDKLRQHRLSEQQSSTASEAERARLNREYEQLAEHTDYSEIERGSALSDLGRSLSLGRSLVSAAYDIPRLESELKDAPGDPEMYVALAEAIIQSRWAETVRKSVTAAVNPTTLLVWGAAAAMRESAAVPREIGLVRIGLTLAGKILHVEPRNAWAHVVAARAYLLLGEPESAAKHLKIGVLLHPNWADLYYLLALCFESRDKHELALSYLICGARLGSAICAESVRDTLDGYETTKETAFPNADVIRRRLEKVLAEPVAEPDDGEEVGMIDQFLQEKAHSLWRVGRRIERMMDTLVLPEPKEKP